ncbi:MAG: ATP-binding cassette domain-containing protein [Bacteroidales bacterium]|nr:ATP-binding cassette domain-containing protein [Bacteroidales bacterium]
MEILRTQKVVKQFENHRALSEISISVEEGTVFGLLGPNGAGKTTLIRIINQITAPDEGEVFLFNEKLKPEHIKDIGYLPEERGLYKKMKVGEQAMYFAQLKGMSKNDAKAKLNSLFDKFEINDWWNKKVEELSKGMQQKVQFITTIVHEPKLLIFDEPFSGFDPINADILKKEILALRDKGTSVIFSTHNMASVEEVCDHIALIDNSHKILDGKVSEIKEQFKSNVFEIVFDGNFNKFSASLTADYELVENIQQNGTSIVKVKLLNKISPNELLSKMLQFGKIISFNEVIPSMHDIFVKAVKGNNQ